MDWEDKLNELNTCQRQGKSSEVLAQVSRLTKKKISKQWRARFADLARRAGDPLLSLKILTHGVPSQRSILTDQEKLAYAAGLIALGNTKEAQKWLRQIQHVELAREGEFFQALALMRQWDYAQALVKLENYQKIAGSTGYRVLVVRVNIIACLVATSSISRAEKMMPALHSELQANGATLLLWNLAEIEAQLKFMLGQPISASIGSDEVTNGPAVLFIRKWQALAGAKLATASEFRNNLVNLRLLANEMGHWETLRDLDYYEVKATRDRHLFNKLYWGTPFAAFRERLRSIPLEVSNEIVLGPSSQVEFKTIDPWGELKHGSILDRIFRALLTDLYRPLGLGELFERVYPDEFFNPENSPARLHRSLFRLQRWLAGKPWGIQIDIKKGEFCLRFTSKIKLNMPERRDPRLSRLEAVWGAKWFLRTDIERVLQLPERSVRRLLSQWLKLGHIEIKDAVAKRPEYRICASI